MTAVKATPITKDNAHNKRTHWTLTVVFLTAALIGSAHAQSFRDRALLADASAATPSALAPSPSALAPLVPSRVFATPTVIAPKSSSRARTMWILSGLALTAASMADLGTSIGGNEANPALRGSNGQFSVGRGVSIKLGITGVTMLVQSLLTRHHSDMYGPSTVINLVGAGVLGGVAYHNANTH